MVFDPNYRKTRKTQDRGTRAAQPLATNVLEGTIYFVTDEGVIERSNGTIWQSYSGSGGSFGSSIHGIPGLDAEEPEYPYTIPGPAGLVGATGATGAAGSPGIHGFGIDGIDGEDAFSYPPSVPVPAAASGVATQQDTAATGTQNNFSLNAHLTYLRCNNASALTFTGFTVNGNAPITGDVVIIDNIGSSTVKVADQNASSTAANQVICPSTNGQIIGANGRMQLIYDATSSRWREELIEPGAAITIPFNAGDFTGNIAMTWTLDAADLVGANYIQRGKQLLMNVIINSSTVGGTPNNELRMALPGGFTGAGTATLIFFQRDNGTSRTGLAQMLNSGTYVQLFKSDFTNYAASTNNNDELFSFQFGVN